MRLDKFLKITRLIKRRTIAKEVIEQDVVYVNGRLAKPSKEVQVGDEIRLILGKKELTIRVMSLPATSLKKDTKEMYEVLSLKVLNPSQPS